MPITLNSPEQAQKLTGLKWVCCECLTVNRPNIIDCVACGKQRWAQFAFTRTEALAAAATINDEGHGA